MHRRAGTYSWSMRWTPDQQRSTSCCAASGEREGASARRDRLVAAIVVKAALGLAAEPAGLDVFYQQRTRPVLGVRETLMQDLHDRQTGIEADEIGEFERPHRMVRP